MSSILYASTVKLTAMATNAVKDIVAASQLGPNPDPVKLQAGLHILTLTCLIVLVIFSVRYVLTRIQMMQLAYASNKLAADLRERLFLKLMKLPIGFFNESRMGSILSTFTNDVNVYQFAINVIQDSINAPVRALAAFVLIVFMQPFLMPVAIVLIGVMAVYIQNNARKMKRAQAAVQEDLADLNAATDEHLQGVRIIRAFGAEAAVNKEYGGLIRKTLNSQMGAAAVLASLKPLVDLIGAAGLAAVLFIAGEIAAKGSLQVGDIAAMALAMDMINQGFKSLASLSSTVASVSAASDRIYKQILDVSEETGHEGGRTRPSAMGGRIEFRNVSFSYPDGTKALDRVSFVIEPGECLALVGPSGAGKSTIADLILRFYLPTEGQILFDGKDAAELDTEWVRSCIGVVPQQTFLFAGSIEENVRLGRPDATDQEVQDALAAAHAEGFAAEMAMRTTAELGERGVRLSGGQMQRVAIARALVRRPAILLLDEATSALDARSESIVNEALQEIMEQRTTLLIAHRLTTAARADKILYLKAGHVVETGSHTELIERRGEYAALFQLFSGGVIDVALTT